MGVCVCVCIVLVCMAHAQNVRTWWLYVDLTWTIWIFGRYLSMAITYTHAARACTTHDLRLAATSLATFSWDVLRPRGSRTSMLIALTSSWNNPNCKCPSDRLTIRKGAVQQVPRFPSCTHGFASRSCATARLPEAALSASWMTDGKQDRSRCVYIQCVELVSRDCF